MEAYCARIEEFDIQFQFNRGDIYSRKTIKTNFYKVRCQVVHVGEIRFLKRQALGVWNNSVKEWREMTQQPLSKC